MIIIVHSLYFLVRHLLKIYRAAKAINSFQNYQLIGKEVNIQTNCLVTDSLDLRFDPPLYKQRYATVQQIILNLNWRSSIKKVVDFGCAELNFFIYLKHLYDVTEIICVDIDEQTLKDNLFRIHPLTVDYLKKRSQPLKVQVLAGNVSQPDARLIGCDAVIGIELIEHLYPDTLEALPYNVFHYIKPLLAIFTTPNSEFNVLFPDAKKFRHPDHKFEWTREQFQSWALNIITRFPDYTVQFEGVGPGPKGTESVGDCSQVAIFLRCSIQHEQLSEVPRSCREIKRNNGSFLHTETINESQGICTYYSYVNQMQEFSEMRSNERDHYYKEIECQSYPYEIDTRTVEEKMCHEVQYKLYSSANVTNRFYNEDMDRIEYPLYELVSNDEGCFITVPELRKLLEKENIHIEECLVSKNSDERALCAILNLRMDSQSSSPSSDDSSSDDKNTFKIPWNASVEESDWEAEYNQTVKVNDNAISTIGHEISSDDRQKDNEVREADEQKVAFHIHSAFVNNPDQLENKEEFKPQRNVTRPRSSSKTVLATTSTTLNNTEHRTPKKGTNIKNRDTHYSSHQGTSRESGTKRTVMKIDNKLNNNNDDRKTSYKKNIELKIQDSAHSQGSNISKINRNTKSSLSNNSKSGKGKIMITSSLKRFPTKLDDNPLPSTSDLKKRKKGKKNDEEKDDIKALTECIIYNTLNNIQELEEHVDESSTSRRVLSNKSSRSDNSKINDIIKQVDNIVKPLKNDAVGRDIIEHILSDTSFTTDRSNLTDRDGLSQVDDRKTKDLTAERINQELNHASREALFDPNSEIDMLEEFEIPPTLPAPPAVEVLPNAQHNQHHNVILIGLNIGNEEEGIVLPDNADPFPNWLLQLLGANVEEGESHDEPHFYCQGDGIGVHPSVIEVEIDEEESSSDSSSSHDEAEAEHTNSDSGVVQIPTDEAEDLEPHESSAAEASLRTIPMITPPGSTSAADSADEFFDSIEESVSISDRQNSEVNKRNT